MRIDPLRPGPRPRARRDEEGGAPSSKEAKEKVRLGPGGALRRTMSTCAGTSEQLRSNNAQTPGKTRHHQGPEDEARHYERRPCTVCKTSIPGSNPGGASIFRRNSPDSAGACLAGHSLLLRKALELLLTPKSDFCKALHRDELSACDRRRGGGSEDLRWHAPHDRAGADRSANLRAPDGREGCGNDPSESWKPYQAAWHPSGTAPQRETGLGPLQSQERRVERAAQVVLLSRCTCRMSSTRVGVDAIGRIIILHPLPGIALWMACRARATAP